MKKLLKCNLVFLILAYLFSSCDSAKKDDHAGHDQQIVQEVYACPMHPEIISKAPGSCPICGMDLVSMEPGNKPVRDVGLAYLLKPANEYVVSAIPLTSIQEREEIMELKFFGTVAYDTRQVGVISSRLSGRIEKLYIRYKYQPVKKGQKVMDIYSPVLMTAQQNLIFLLNNDPANASLIHAAESRLLLMGMTPNQVKDLVRTRLPKYSLTVFSNYTGFVTDISTTTVNSPADGMQPPAAANQELKVREGMYVENGQVVFTVYNPSRALVMVDFFPEQHDLVKKGNAVVVIPETAPDKKFSAKIDYIEPLFRPGARTLRARVYFNNGPIQLPIGSRVTAYIFAGSGKVFWLPKEAVLSLGRDKIVFLKEPGGFITHKVSTGLELSRTVQVVTGLTLRDSVASNAHFLVDNEAFIKVNK